MVASQQVSNGSGCSPGEIRINRIETWSDHELTAFGAMMRRRTKDSPWKGRWDLGDVYYRWKFAGNPLGPALMFGAWQGDELLGSFSLCPVAFERGGQRLKGGELGDIYVEERLRGHGVFRRMVLAMATAARDEAFELVFCVPNAAGYKALLGTGEFLAAPRAARKLCVLPLSFRRFGPSVLKTLDPIWQLLIGVRFGRDSDPVSFEWQALQQQTGAGDVRAVFDPAHRIGEYPDPSRYKIVGRQNAWAITKETEHSGRRFLMIGALSAPSLAERRAVLHSLIRQAARDGYDAIALWIHRDDLLATIRPTMPFLPADSKDFVFLKTPCAEAVAASGARVEIDLIHTDKI